MKNTNVVSGRPNTHQHEESVEKLELQCYEVSTAPRPRRGTDLMTLQSATIK